jgi:hypothetical protein
MHNGDVVRDTKGRSSSPSAFGGIALHERLVAESDTTSEGRWANLRSTGIRRRIPGLRVLLNGLYQT